MKVMRIVALLALVPLFAFARSEGASSQSSFESSFPGRPTIKVNVASRTPSFPKGLSGGRVKAGTLALKSGTAFPMKEFYFSIEGQAHLVRSIVVFSAGNKLAEMPIQDGKRDARHSFREIIPAGDTTFEYYVDLHTLGATDHQQKISITPYFIPENGVEFHGGLLSPVEITTDAYSPSMLGTVWLGGQRNILWTGLGRQMVAEYVIPSTGHNIPSQTAYWKKVFVVDVSGFDWVSAWDFSILQKHDREEFRHDADFVESGPHPYRPDTTRVKIGFSGIKIGGKNGHHFLLEASFMGRLWSGGGAGRDPLVSAWADFSEWRAVLEDGSEVVVTPAVGHSTGRIGSFGTSDLIVPELKGKITALPVLAWSGTKGLTLLELDLSAGWMSDILLSSFSVRVEGGEIDVSNLSLYRGDTLIARGREVVQEDREYARYVGKIYEFRLETSNRLFARSHTPAKFTVRGDVSGFGVGGVDIYGPIEAKALNGAEAIQTYEFEGNTILVLPFMLRFPIFPFPGLG